MFKILFPELQATGSELLSLGLSLLSRCHTRPVSPYGPRQMVLGPLGYGLTFAL